MHAEIGGPLLPLTCQLKGFFLEEVQLSFYLRLGKMCIIIIIIIVNMVNTPRRVQRYGYNRNYNTTADTIAFSSLWLK